MSRYYGKGWIVPTTRQPRTRLMLASTASLTALTFAVSASADESPLNIDQVRADAQALAERAGCANAMLDLQSLAGYSRRALDWIAVGECAIEAGDAEAAAEAFWQAITYRQQLDEAQRIYAGRSLGYQAEAAGQYSRAAIAWADVARLTDDPADIVMAARSARLDGRAQAASARLQRLEPASLSGPSLALYYEERALALAEQQPDAAAMYMAQAIAVEDRAYRRYQRGLYLGRAGDERGALAEFQTALAAEPQNTAILLSTAYAARRAGDPELASALFQRAIELNPDRPELREELAYAQMAADNEEAAAESFRFAILNAEPREDETVEERDERIYRLRRQVEQLERRTYGFAFASYRDGSAPTAINLPETGPNETQVGGEFGWRPDALNTANTGLTFFGRGYVSANPGTITLNEDTLQLGVGARWKPFEGHDFYLAGERLIAGGDLARDAWLLRASYGWSDGLDWNPVRTDWNYTTVFGDLAYIPDNPEFLSAYASVRQGRRFRTGDRWTVTPYVTAVGQWSDDTFQTRERLEVGPGVVFTRWLDEDATTAPRQRVDFEMEYRFGVGDTDDEAFIARAVWHF